jgi:hypothetical protein
MGRRARRRFDSDSDLIPIPDDQPARIAGGHHDEKGKYEEERLEERRFGATRG